MQPEVSFEMDLYQKTSENQILANNGSRKLIATIEGELIIRTQDVVVFQEDVLLLEFTLALQAWINQILTGENTNFSYQTMDFDEGPILAFIYIEGNSWRITSIWARNESPMIDIMSLIVASEEFMQFFSNSLYKMYRIRPEHFLSSM